MPRPETFHLFIWADAPVGDECAEIIVFAHNLPEARTEVERIGGAALYSYAVRVDPLVISRPWAMIAESWE